VTERISARQVLAHRGVWSHSGSKGNSPEALFEAINQGLSLETDIRDHGGRLVISHDPMPLEETPLELQIVLGHLRASMFSDCVIALNIKSDGLATLLNEVLAGEDELRERVYFFDMSIPETLRYSKLNLPFALRLSEYESLDSLTTSPWPTAPKAVWVDGFHRDWFLEDGGQKILRLADKHLVTIVSPELHGRDAERFVDWFIENAAENKNLTVCTDLPERFLS